MIPRTQLVLEPTPWQQELSNCIADPEQLFALLQLPHEQLDAARAACRDFPLRVPHPYLKRIAKGDLDDPLLKQILPLGDELIAAPGYNTDPVGESQTNPAPGLIHKYRGRVLLIVSPACAINCRYCFRRHFPYQDNKPSRAQWQQALDYIAGDSTIDEVIYSGGDPLAASDRQLAWLTEQVAAIPHIQRLRVHTRLPVVIPQRVTSECLDWLTNHRLQPVVVIHSNHGNEIDSAVASAMARLKEAGVTLLNQAVLLGGINDNSDTLADLSQRLFEVGVLPYYLHVLDKVQGAAHFAVSEERARQLAAELLTRLPGYLVPKLVREDAGCLSKTPLQPLL
ncbi:EF-P beta-lysylation protein EpmB [Porticoccus sp. W117]|uniref:EF-P beta-lysylation protein EpmB n=1 Tax=Porticoccus sp. W117 TaxID=3054777 RepID=UPI002594021B|nr:EF-P beta-lysylation protein EpmB [Porticoccus sp. W117]MDM3872444.1 EF-P beta-lysylation protein EpmB [Porticoccus sp. W117]